MMEIKSPYLVAKVEFLTPNAKRNLNETFEGACSKSLRTHTELGARLNDFFS